MKIEKQKQLSLISGLITWQILISADESVIVLVGICCILLIQSTSPNHS